MSKSRDIADSAATINFIDTVTSNVQTQLNTLDTALDNISVTSGTLTKTFTNGESASISLTSSVLAPVVSVTKEVPQTGTTNNSWDVNSTTENYTRLDSAAATTLGWVASGDVDESSYTGNSFDLTNQDTSVWGIAFNANGSKMFICGNGTATILEYNLSVNYNVSTAVYSQSLDVSAQATSILGLSFNTDGTKMFVSDNTSDNIREYTLSSGFDLSTASYSQAFSVSSQVSNPRDNTFSSDGTKMFVCNIATDSVLIYTLSIGFDISTASYSSSFSVASQDATMYSVKFNSDGTRMYGVGAANDSIYQYNLSTGFDLSTATFNSSFSIIGNTNSPSSIAITQVGFTLLSYGGTGGQKVFQYNLPTALTLGTGSFASADVGKTIEANSGAFVLTATSGSYVETTAPTSYDQVASGDWSMYGVVYNAADGDLELSSTLGNKFNVSTAVYSQGFSITAQETLPEGLAFNTDGTKMFIVGQGGDDVNEYTLSTAFDVSTASFVDSFSISAQDTIPSGITFNNNGTKMFILGRQGDDVNEYTLSTGFDVSTAAYSQAFSVSAQETEPSELAFNTDGTKMFIVGFTGDDVNEYALSTAFNISTATFVDSFSVSAQASAPTGLAFNTDGTKMYVLDNASNNISQYSLSTGFDVSTASYSQTFSITSQETSGTGLAFNTDGTKMFVIGTAADSVLEYSIGTSVTPTGYQPVHTTASTDTTYWTDINSMTADQNAGDGEVYYAISTDDRTTWTVIDNTDGERDIVRNNAGTWQYNSNGTYASETWVNGATNTELATIAEAMEGAAAGYNLANASYSSKSYSPPLGLFYADIAVKSDGTKFYVLHNGTPQALYQYSMSTPFDITTGSYDSVSFTLQDNNVNGLYFRDDGLKFYVVTGDADSVYAYSCSTAWDLSTASYDSVSFSVSSQDTNPYDIAFKSDGTKMYMLGLTNDTVYQYTLSTAWDVSTASYDSVSFSVTSQESTPASIQFNNDGTEMYVLGFSSDSVHQYNLSTSWDLSTASYSNISFSVASQETTPRGFAFANSGANFYIVGDTTDVFQYAAPSYINQMDKTQLDAVTDPNHIALGNDLDLAIIFNMTSGSTVPSSDGVAINYDANVLNKGAVLGTDYDFDAPAQDSVRITALAGNNLKVRVV